MRPKSYCSTACDQCFRCKARCSGEKPHCERCRRVGGVCTYSVQKPRGQSIKDTRPQLHRSGAGRSETATTSFGQTSPGTQSSSSTSTNLDAAFSVKDADSLSEFPMFATPLSPTSPSISANITEFLYHADNQEMIVTHDLSLNCDGGQAAVNADMFDFSRGPLQQTHMGGFTPASERQDFAFAGLDDFALFCQTQLQTVAHGADRTLELAQRSLSFVSACLQLDSTIDQPQTQSMQGRSHSSTSLLAYILIVKAVHACYIKLMASGVPVIGNSWKVTFGCYAFGSDNASYDSILAAVIESEIRRCESMTALLRSLIEASCLASSGTETDGQANFHKLLVSTFFRCLEEQIRQKPLV